MPYKNETDRRANAKKYREANKEKMAEYDRSPEKRAKNKILCAKWYERNKEAVRIVRRKYGLKVKYGITIEEWDALLSTQGGVCAICKTVPTGNYHWATDHCHTTGHVRGILCNRCNCGLGYFQDCTTTMSEAINYLRSTQPR